MNKNLLLLLLVLVSLSFGVIAGTVVGDPLVGLAAGAPLAALMTLLIRADRMQWLMATIVVIAFVVSVFLCFPYSYIYALLSIVLGILLGANGLRHIYCDDMSTALNYLFKLSFGKPISAQVVAEPTAIVERGKTNEVGPQTITVNPETAIVLESGARQTDIVGPSVHQSRPFEYVRRVYSLRPHHIVFKFTKVLTQNMISTQVGVGLTYGLAVATDARTGRRNLSSSEIEAINLFAACADNWQEELSTLVEATARQEIGEISFAEVMLVSRQKLIEATIARRVSRATQDWGLAIHRVNLIQIQPHQGIPTALKDNWLATARSEMLARYEVERARAWANALRVVNEAYEEFVDNNGQRFVLLQELTRRMLAQAANDSVTMNLIPRELRRLMTESEAHSMDQSTESGEEPQGE